MKKLNLTRTLYKMQLGVKKHSPEILIATGILGVITGAVIACKETLSVKPIIYEHNKKIKDLKFDNDLKKATNKDGINKKEYVKNTVIIYGHTGLKLVKLYAPSISIGVLSLTAIVSSNIILRKRNVALAAAFTAINNSFKDYRSRVIEKYGEDIDKELRFNLKQKGKDDETDDNVTNKIPEYSPFTVCFDECCAGWTKDANANLIYLRQLQNYFNEQLQIRGHVFVNEIYDALGIPRRPEGQCAGWIYDPDNPKHKGDNFIDFGIYDIDKEGSRDFVNGRERSIWLDFNIDGDILNSIKK